MEAVSKGICCSNAWFDGAVIGITPSYLASDANPYCDIVIPTGLQIARNVIVASAADVVVAFKGGAGTLSEIAIAWQLGKPILALGGHGWSGELAGRSVDDRREAETVVACSDIAAVIQQLHAACARDGREPHDIGLGPRRDQ